MAGLPYHSPTPQGTASLLVACLERTWHAIRQRHPDVPDAVLVVASGSDGKRLNLGHFAAHRWQVAGADRHEVLVGGEGLHRGPVDVLGTLLHEAAHTTVREPTASGYAAQLAELAAALVLWRRLELHAGTTSKARNLLACTCDCGRRIRAAKTTLAEAPILCGLCEQPFQPDDQEL